MTTAQDLALLRALWVQAHTDELAAFDLAAHAPTVANLTAVRSRIANDLTSISAQVNTIIGHLPTPAPTRAVKATISTTAPGRVDLAEVGFQASARRRDGGTPAVAGDAGWSGPIVGGPAPGRDLTFLRPGTTYVVGMQDAAKGDWVSVTVKVPGTAPTPIPTGTEGLAGVRAHLGQQQNQYRYIAAVTQHWNAAGDGKPISWRWATNTVVESMSDLTDYRDAVPADGPVPVLRVADTVSVIDRGIDDADITAKAQVLQQIAAKQGRPPIARLFYEWDSNWMRWSIDPTDPAPFLDAVQRVVGLIHAQCPSCEIDLTGDLGYGGGPMTAGSHANNLWSVVFDGLKARGVKVTYLDTDCYPNGGMIQSVAWLKAELAMIEAFCVKYGLRVAHGEWGVASVTVGAEGPFNIDTETWVDTFIDFWAGLPAGMFGHVEFFDLGGDGVFPDGRGGVLVPVEGSKMAARFKQRLVLTV